MKITAKLYKTLDGKSLTYKIFDDDESVRMFRDDENKELCLKDEEKRRNQNYEKWREKENKRCYQRFLKEFKISPSKEGKIFPAELLKGEFFFQFYNSPGLTWDKKTNIISSGKSMTALEREAILESLFDKFTKLECMRFAALYKLDWQDLYQEAKIKLFKIRGKYNPQNKEEASLLTYYQRVIRNTILDLVRKERRQPIYSEKIMKIYDNKAVDIKNVDLDLDSLLDKFKLTSKQKEAIKMKIDGFRDKESAKLLGITADTLKDRLKGVKKKVMKKYPLK